MSKERELLRRALEVLDEKVIGYEITKGAIRPYLDAAPARKPMTDREIEKGMDVQALSHKEACAFASGIRFAEKHHGIQTVEMQSKCRGDKDAI